jgi:hypothetical protein
MDVMAPRLISAGGANVAGFGGFIVSAPPLAVALPLAADPEPKPLSRGLAKLVADLASAESPRIQLPFLSAT